MPINSNIQKSLENISRKEIQQVIDSICEDILAGKDAAQGDNLELRKVLIANIKKELETIEWPEKFSNRVVEIKNGLTKKFVSSYIEKVYLQVKSAQQPQEFENNRNLQSNNQDQLIRYREQHQKKYAGSEFKQEFVAQQINTQDEINRDLYFTLNLIAKRCRKFKVETDVNQSEKMQEYVKDMLLSLPEWIKAANKILSSIPGHEKLTSEEKRKFLSQLISVEDKRVRYAQNPQQPSIKLKLDEKIEQYKNDVRRAIHDKFIQDIDAAPEQEKLFNELVLKYKIAEKFNINEQIVKLFKKKIKSAIATEAQQRELKDKGFETSDVEIKFADVYYQIKVAEQLMLTVDVFALLSDVKQDTYINKLGKLVKQFIEIQVNIEKTQKKITDSSSAQRPSQDADARQKLQELQTKETQIKTAIKVAIEEIIVSLPDSEQQMVADVSLEDNNLDDLLEKVKKSKHKTLLTKAIEKIDQYIESGFKNNKFLESVSNIGVAIIELLDKYKISGVIIASWKALVYWAAVVLSEIRDIIEKPRAYVDRIVRGLFIAGAIVGMVFASITVVALISTPTPLALAAAIAVATWVSSGVVAVAAKLSKWISSFASEKVYGIDNPDRFIVTKAAIDVIWRKNNYPELGESQEEYANKLRDLLVDQIKVVNQRIEFLSTDVANDKQIELLKKKVELVEKIWEYEIQKGNCEHLKHFSKLVNELALAPSEKELDKISDTFINGIQAKVANPEPAVELNERCDPSHPPILVLMPRQHEAPIAEQPPIVQHIAKKHRINVGMIINMLLKRK